jgi:hypothetical protein
MSKKVSGSNFYNGNSYRTVSEEGKDPIIERKNGEEWVPVGSYNDKNEFSPSGKQTEDELKNYRELIKISKSAAEGATITEESLVTINYRGVGKNSKFNKIKVYPSNMSDDQDRMEFTVWEYKDRGIVGVNPQTTVPAFGSTTKGREAGFNRVESAGFTYLPISKTSDTNSIDFQEDRLNEIQRNLANLSLGLMTGGTNRQGVESGISGIDQFSKFITASPAGNLARLYFAGQAVQVNNLLTRATGAILNPNLELLFNGPQLRQFSFGFDLFAKEDKDAEMIKDIIYFFKAYMSIRDNLGDLGQFATPDSNLSTTEAETTSTGVFLNTPYLFRIRYLKGARAEHQSIGKIKMCALQSCTVDYTPMGTYMTFNDEEATMVMYRITLQFKELTPVYASDYQSDHPIGF